MKESIFTKILKSILLIGQVVLLIEDLLGLADRIHRRRKKREVEEMEAEARLAKATLELDELVEKLKAKKVS